VLDEIVLAVSGVALIAADQAVFEPEHAQSFKIPHGGGEGELFDRRAVGIGGDREVEFVRLIAEHRGDDEHMGAVGGKTFDGNRHLQLFDATRAQQPRAAFSVRRFPRLPGSRRLGSSSLNAMRARRGPEAEMTGSMAIKLTSSGRECCFEKTPTRIRPRGPGKPPGEGKPNTRPSLRPHIKGSPGACGQSQAGSVSAPHREIRASRRGKLKPFNYTGRYQ